MANAIRIYTPRAESPMRVICFVSGGGGNLRAALGVTRDFPDLVEIGLVVSDRPGIPAIGVADENAVPTLVYDFESACGRWKDARGSTDSERVYRRNARHFHDRVTDDIERWEETAGRRFDLVVLSYNRWIHGRLLVKFEDRIINQHPGDLVLREGGRRILVGINPVEHAIRLGHSSTRTSTFLVNSGEDAGEILCQGPRVPVIDARPGREYAQRHEMLKKERSDWPSLRFALREIALGNFAVSSTAHETGERVIEHRGRPLPYGGVDLETEPTWNG